MDKVIRKILAFILSLSILAMPVLAEVAYASKNKTAPQKTQKPQKVSSDIIFTERAGDGARCKLLPNPEAYEAGIEPVTTFLVIGVGLALISAYNQNAVDRREGKGPTVEGAGKVVGEIAGGAVLHAVGFGLVDAPATIGKAAVNLLHDAKAIDQQTAEKWLNRIDYIDPIELGSKVQELYETKLLNPIIQKLTSDSSPSSETRDRSLSRISQINSELINNNEFSSGLDGWDFISAFTTSQLGPVSGYSVLSNDGIFAVTHTGKGDVSEHGYIEQQVSVPMPRNANFNMLYNFVTSEFPEYYGTKFNDYYQVTIKGPSGEILLSNAEHLNDIPESVYSNVSNLPSNIFDKTTGGQTGWKIFQKSTLPLKSGIYTLRIEVRDVGDRIVDSAILVDRVSLR